MDPNNIYNITHSSDLDGMSSAAFLVRNLSVPIKNIYFTNYGGELFEDTLKFLKGFRKSGSLLIISDYGVNNKTFSRLKDAIASFKLRGNSVMWFDHHLWSDKQVGEMAKHCDLMVVGENPNCCGAELVYRFLCERNKKSDEIARITHLSDFDPVLIKSVKDRRLIDKVGNAIYYLRGHESLENPRLRRLVLHIAEGRLGHRYIMKAAETYYRISEPRLKKVMGSLVKIKCGGVKVSVGFGKKVRHQDITTRMLDDGADIVIYCAEDSGHSSVRSKAWVESSGISFALGGGGHPNASGFTVKKSDFDLSRKSGRGKFIKKIWELLKGGKAIRRLSPSR